MMRISNHITEYTDSVYIGECGIVYLLEIVAFIDALFGLGGYDEKLGEEKRSGKYKKEKVITYNKLYNLIMNYITFVK